MARSFLRDGKLQQYSLLVALGQILQIDELTQLHLEQAEVKYHISPGIVTIDQLLLRSPNIRLTATGTISFSGKLRLDSQLALNDKVRRQLFAPIRENFQTTRGAGWLRRGRLQGERDGGSTKNRSDGQTRRARSARSRWRNQQPFRPSEEKKSQNEARVAFTSTDCLA